MKKCQPPVLIDAIWDVVDGQWVAVTSSVKGLHDISGKSKSAFSRVARSAINERGRSVTVRYLGPGIRKPDLKAA